MKRKLGIIILVIITLQHSLAYSFDTLYLSSLLEEAKKNNPDILAAKKRYEASTARVPQAKSLDNPSIGLTFEKIPRGTLKLNKSMPEDRMLSLSQMFPLFGKLSLKGKIALVESQMFAAEYKNKELEVMNNVKNAYYGLFMNYKEVELDGQSLKFLEALAKIAENKYIVGDIPQEEIFKIYLEIASVSNNIINLKEEKLSRQARLNTLLNKDPELPLGAPILEEDTSFGKEISSLYKLTLENQPELLTLSYAIEKNKYAKSLAKKSFFPDLMAGLIQRGITSGTIGPWDLMLAFSVPLWFWTKQRYEVKESIANLEEAEAAYNAMQNKALFETKDLFSKIEVAKNKVNLYKNSQIPILENSIQSSVSAYASGKGDLMLLLDTQRMLVEAKMNYYKALAAYNMNLADLERAVGKDLR